MCTCHAGNYEVYSAFSKFTTTPGDSTYCDATLYWYAFWITTSVYILVGVIIVAVCVVDCVYRCYRG